MNTPKFPESQQTLPLELLIRTGMLATSTFSIGSGYAFAKTPSIDQAAPNLTKAIQKGKSWFEVSLYFQNQNVAKNGITVIPSDANVKNLAKIFLKTAQDTNTSLLQLKADPRMRAQFVVALTKELEGKPEFRGIYDNIARIQVDKTGQVTVQEPINWLNQANFVVLPVVIIAVIILLLSKNKKQIQQSTGFMKPEEGSNPMCSLDIKKVKGSQRNVITTSTSLSSTKKTNAWDDINLDDFTEYPSDSNIGAVTQLGIESDILAVFKRTKEGIKVGRLFGKVDEKVKIKIIKEFFGYMVSEISAEFMVETTQHKLQMTKVIINDNYLELTFQDPITFCHKTELSFNLKSKANLAKLYDLKITKYPPGFDS